MGITASFAVLAELPADRRLALVEAALRDPHPALQAAAFALLADPAGLHRPDLLVLRYASLASDLRERMAADKSRYLKAAEELLRSDREGERRAALGTLAALDPYASAPVLVRALEDPAPVVKDAAAALLDDLGQRHYYHLIAGRMHGDPESLGYLKRHRAGMLDLLPSLLRSFVRHQKRVFLDIAVESEPDSYPVIVEHVLLRGDRAVRTAFLQTLDASATEQAVRLLFRLAAERGARLRDVGVDAFRRRLDAGFPSLVVSMLSKLLPDEFDALATGATDLPWWPAPEILPAIDPLTAARLLEFAARSAVPARRRDELILRFLRSPHPETRIRALSMLQVLEHPGFLAVAEDALEDPADDVKIAAARAVIGLNPPNKAKLLMPLIEAPSEELRRLALREIASAGVDRYLAAFDRLDGHTREVAARALAKIDPRVVDRLLEELAARDPARRLAALRAVDILGGEEANRERLLPLLQDPDRRVRATALRIVKVARLSEGFGLLAEALGDPDPRVRANAVEALEETGDPRAVALLLPLADDPQPRIRANAGKALCRLGRDEGRRALEAMCRHASDAMRLSAAWAVGQARFEGARLLLHDRAGVETSPVVLAKIADALSQFQEVPP